MYWMDFYPTFFFWKVFDDIYAFSQIKTEVLLRLLMTFLQYSNLSTFLYHFSMAAH